MNPSNHPFAVVTGASSGIGYELAAQFAEHGFDVLIAAEDAGINEAARRLASGGTTVESLQVDLATYEGVEQLCQKIQAGGRTPDAVALNAGIGTSGEFARDSDLSHELELIRLNVMSPVHLAKRVLPEMISHGGGKMLFTSSIAATMPGAFAATYNASKAFLKSFAEAIREELKETGVTVTTLMPGPTATEFFERAKLEDTKLGAGKKDDAAQVAKEGYEALMAGKDHVVAGSFMNKVQATISHVLPDTVTAGMHRKQAEPGSAHR